MHLTPLHSPLGDWIEEYRPSRLTLIAGVVIVIMIALEARHTVGVVVTSLLSGLATLSPDGRTIAINDESGITLWDVPPRRPLSCWLTCFTLALLAVGVGRPRKGKHVVNRNGLMCHC